MNLFSYALSEPLAMDQMYAFNLLSEYNNVMSQIEAGVPFDKTSYSEKRASQKMASMQGIAHMRLSGFMQLDGGLCSRGINELISDIRAVNTSSLYSGILLEIESGGGQSLSGQALKNAIKDSVLPVVVYGHTIGSAAYHASLYADEIMMSGESASAGSIGTFITLSKKDA